MVIIESDDIVQYLDSNFPDTPLKPSRDSDRELMDQGLKRAVDIHVEAVKTHIYAKRVRGQMKQSAEEKDRYETLQKNPALLEFHEKSSKDSFSQQEINNAEAILDSCFVELNESLEARDWIAGDAFSLADIAWIPLEFTLKNLASYSFYDLPNVQAWSKKIEARASFQEAVLHWWPDNMPRWSIAR